MSEQYKARMTMHLNRGALGSTILSELVDFKGVMVQDDYSKKTRSTVRTIFYKDAEFKTLDEAVAHWRTQNEVHPKNG